MKIITTKKYANIWGGRDPYKVDFAHEEEKARSMDPESLFGALKDAIEASQVSVNAGKYFDQASVYRKELLRRNISIEEQDKQLQGMKSLHFNSGESQNPMDRVKCKICDQSKHWEDMSNDNETCKECDEENRDAQAEGKNLFDSGRNLDYPELGAGSFANSVKILKTDSYKKAQLDIVKCVMCGVTKNRDQMANDDVCHSCNDKNDYNNS